MADPNHTPERLTLLTWAVGLAVALSIAELGMIASLAAAAVNISHQLGEITGQLAVLTGHVVLK